MGDLNLVECSHEVCVKVNEMWMKGGVEERKLIEFIVRTLRKTPSMSSRAIEEYLKEHVGISRATMFRWLRKYGLTFDAVKEALSREFEEKYEKRIEVMEVGALTPTGRENLSARGTAGTIVEARISKEKVIVIPKSIAEAVGVREGQRVKVMVVGDRIVVEPVRDVVWLALYGRRIGRILPEEVEEESLHEQERLSG